MKIFLVPGQPRVSLVPGNQPTIYVASGSSLYVLKSYSLELRRYVENSFSEVFEWDGAFYACESKVIENNVESKLFKLPSFTCCEAGDAKEILNYIGYKLVNRRYLVRIIGDSEDISKQALQLKDKATGSETAEELTTNETLVGIYGNNVITLVRSQRRFRSRDLKLNICWEVRSNNRYPIGVVNQFVTTQLSCLFQFSHR